MTKQALIFLLIKNSKFHIWEKNIYCITKMPFPQVHRGDYAILFWISSLKTLFLPLLHKTPKNHRLPPRVSLREKENGYSPLHSLSTLQVDLRQQSPNPFSSISLLLFPSDTFSCLSLFLSPPLSPPPLRCCQLFLL